jgi:hypothetical protein
MPIELLITAAAVVVSFLLLTWLVKVVKATLGTAIKVALLALLLQVFLGIGPQVIWNRIMEFIQQFWK